MITWYLNIFNDKIMLISAINSVTRSYIVLFHMYKKRRRKNTKEEFGVLIVIMYCLSSNRMSYQKHYDTFKAATENFLLVNISIQASFLLSQ